MFQIVKVQEKQIWPRTRASHHQDGGRFHEDRRRVRRVFRCGRREGPQPETGGGQQKEIRPQRWVITIQQLNFVCFIATTFYLLIFLENVRWQYSLKTFTIPHLMNCFEIVVWSHGIDWLIRFKIIKAFLSQTLWIYRIETKNVNKNQFGVILCVWHLG